MSGPESGAAYALLFLLEPLRGRSDPVQLRSVQISKSSVSYRAPTILLSPAPQQCLLGLSTHAPARSTFSSPLLPSCCVPQALAFQPDLDLAETTSKSHLKATEGLRHRSPT